MSKNDFIKIRKKLSKLSNIRIADEKNISIISGRFYHSSKNVKIIQMLQNIEPEWELQILMSLMKKLKKELKNINLEKEIIASSL